MKQQKTNNNWDNIKIISATQMNMVEIKHEDPENDELIMNDQRL
jgi:hypothetical protein